MENTPPSPIKRPSRPSISRRPRTSVRQSRISKKVRAAIDVMVVGDVKTIREAAEKIGLARDSLSRALSTPHVAEHPSICGPRS